MSESESETQDCIESRTRRALEECMTVLPDFGRAAGAPDLFIVVGENCNGEYLVDLRTESCECADAEYRDPAGGCKHLRRCRIATGESPVPADALGEITIDSTFGAQLETSAKFATADGGIIDGSTGEVIEDDHDHDHDHDSDDEDEDIAESIWSEPKAEIDKYGKPTGDHYVTCEDCGVEVVTALAAHASHRDSCTFE